jgi:hypothetical protein
MTLRNCGHRPRPVGFDVTHWLGGGAADHAGFGVVELDIVQPGTTLSEFYKLSIAAMAGPLISSGVMPAAEEARLEARLDDPDFLGCGFAFIGAWGRPRLGRSDKATSGSTNAANIHAATRITSKSRLGRGPGRHAP